ncbi:hypothetical protein LDENG_00200030 [Lucifuga dentata]|nr:hypothetical protein LDENG_00200030 [Lucifuga dentata]
MHILAELDPVRIRQRSTHRFVCRGCFADGPNQALHVDGYNKLKPFDVAISGCIDGFSRKVMWLKSGSSNNGPGVIARHYMQCVSEFGLLPMCLQTDYGAENGTMAATFGVTPVFHLGIFVWLCCLPAISSACQTLGVKHHIQHHNCSISDKQSALAEGFTMIRNSCKQL